MKNNILLFPLTVLLLVALTACSATPTTALATQAPTTAPAVSVPALESPSLEGLQQAYEKVYQAVLPSVVNIMVTQKVQTSVATNPGNPFGSPDPNQPQGQPNALGSGFVWDSAGHIVTNNHVVEGADTIMVTFSDGTSKPAKLVGVDLDSDLAVIKVEDSAKLTPIQLADSTQVKIGQIAIAIGQPFGLQGTMTVGIISGLGRSLPVDSTAQDGAGYTIPDVIQTDAPINPGNSGGVLVDISGKLIGVTTAIESPVRGNAGIGYVVPSIIVQKVVPDLISKGSYLHAWLGITGRSMTAELAQAMKLNPDQRGALVIKVQVNGPADKAAIHGSDNETTIYGSKIEIGGDIITKVDGQTINEFEDLAAYLARYGEVGKTVPMTVLRGGKEVQLSVTLEARPATTTTAPTAVPGKVSGKSWLGINGLTLSSEIASAMSLNKDAQGVLIIDVTKDSPADKAGLKGGSKPFSLNGREVMVGGDVITKVDNTVITNMNQLRSILATAEPGTKLKLEILRDNKTQTIEVTLEASPNS
jgi:S1-C subfamily serine protease